MLRSLSAAFLLLLSSAAIAETDTYGWDDGACRGTVRYDPQKIDGPALRNTVDLLKSESQTVPISPGAFTPEDFASLDPSAFERSCAATAAGIRSVALLPLAGIEAFRRERAAQVDDACALGSAAMRGYANPAMLRGYRRAADSCDLYTDALEGSTDLVSVWGRVVDAQCAQNASPAACRRRFEQEARGSNATEAMRATVLAFGWTNCATGYAAFNGEQADSLRKVAGTLMKAFLRTYRARMTCDAD